MDRDSYFVQNGCHNCEFSEEIREYDSPSEYVCIIGINRRPKCGSVLMGECFDFGLENKFRNQIEEWDKFKKLRLVDRCGLCRLWEHFKGAER